MKTVLLLLAAATTGGCGWDHSNERVKLAESHAALSEKKAEISELNRKLFSTARMKVDRGDYVLGAGDLLQVTVFETQDLNTEVRVSSRGNVTLPLLGQIKMKGLTAREAEIEIEKQYRQRYIRDPHVSVFVKEHFGQRVTLVGEVKKPGTHDYLSKMRLLDVLALAGGLGDNAGRTVQIRRIGNDVDEQGTFIVDLDKLIKEGKTELNIEINGGDVIFVPEAGMYFVDGSVRKPGSYHIKQKTVIEEALVEAGGLAPYADEKRLTLIRYLDNGQRKVFELDLSKTEVLNMEVRDRDVIIAAASTWGKLVHGTGLNLGVPGFLGIGYRSPEH